MATQTTTATVQQQARALGDPTRHAIFRHVAESPEPVGIAELTERFGFNHNAIRQHVAKLVAAGLLTEAKARRAGPGRPRLVYTVDPAAEGRWGGAGPYERLSRLLVEVIRSGRTPAEVGRDAAGELRPPAPSGDVVADMAAAMARQGFEPEVRPIPGGAEIVLHNCPFESAARTDRETVCSIHLGIAEGLAEGTGVVVEELVARDPRRAECGLRLRLPGGDGAPRRAAAEPKLSLRGRASRS